MKPDWEIPKAFSVLGIRLRPNGSRNHYVGKKKTVVSGKTLRMDADLTRYTPSNAKPVYTLAITFSVAGNLTYFEISHEDLEVLRKRVRRSVISHARARITQHKKTAKRVVEAAESAIRFCEAIEEFAGKQP